MKQVAIVTGGSSGIGLCTANALAERGCTVYELSRSGAASDTVIHLTADVANEHQVRAAIDEVINLEGRIDILVCNAGSGISGAVEFTSVEDAKRLLDVNFFGAVNAVRAALPHMRRSGGGRIVCLSSIAGVLPIPFQTYYSVSKSAINALVMGLSNELRPFGITACAVMPGDVRTGFTAARQKLHDGDDIYDGRIARSVAAMEKDEKSGMPPEIIARAVCRAALRRRPPPLSPVGLQYRFFALLSRILPRRLINRILFSMYAR